MCKAVDKAMEISGVRLVKKEKQAVAAVYNRRTEKKRR
jgi:molybdenum cofactor biosynthesis enzyme